MKCLSLTFSTHNKELHGGRGFVIVGIVVVVVDVVVIIVVGCRI
jgi:hypothetical protein